MGRNIGQGQPAAQSRVLSIFCIPSKHHWYSTGKLCPQHMEAKDPQFNYTIPLSSGILTYPHTLKMSWIMINLFRRRCLRTVEAKSWCVTTYACCTCQVTVYLPETDAWAVADDDVSVSVSSARPNGLPPHLPEDSTVPISPPVAYLSSIYCYCRFCSLSGGLTVFFAGQFISLLDFFIYFYWVLVGDVKKNTKKAIIVLCHCFASAL